MESEAGTDAEQGTHQEPGATEVSDPAPAGGEDSGKSSGGDGDFTYGQDETQEFVDRSKIDFDPADGLYTGSAVEGDSDIPGPSEGDIRAAQEELGDDQGLNDGERAAAEKFIEENDVDLEEAKKGEAIAGSMGDSAKQDAQDDGSDGGSGGDSGGDSDDKSSDKNSADDKNTDTTSADDSSDSGSRRTERSHDDAPKPYPHDGKGPGQ